MTTAQRRYGALTAPDITESLSSESVLCLPIGSMEQHGPHLPLHTDLTIAEGITAGLADRYGASHDLWVLPSFPYGLSLEHAWSPGTVSLTTTTIAALLHQILAEYTRTSPARRLLIINGHGGNKGVLQPLTQELQHSHGVTTCAIHTAALTTSPAPSAAASSGESLPEVHAGIDETSMMLALAPDQVHLDRLPGETTSGITAEEVHHQILDRAANWAWSSGDPAIARHGITGGDPRTATADHGRRLLDHAVDTSRPYLDRLRTATPTPAWRNP